jgi:spore germination cell wall hydrolase CwlJ-like protein
MRNVRRPAILAAISVLSATAISGSVVAPAFGAADVEVAQDNAMLPANVRQIADNEGLTPVSYTIIPEVPDQQPATITDIEDAAEETPEAESQPSATSLAQLVARHAGTETADREQDCLAGAVYFEAKSESLEGQLAVAEVILNRTRSGRFPKSICGVVMQRGQFSFVRGGSMPAIPKASRDWREAVAIAHIAQNELWESSVSNALFFHARHVAPRWRLNRVASLGNHVFYR